MEYKQMAAWDVKPSLLGFGCMRFPTLADGSIDESEAEAMIDAAMQAGVNYIDTAYPYHNGDSEPLVGRVLKKYPRDSFYLATKLPIWKAESPQAARAIFYDQLERLQTDYFDFYLVHALDAARWQKVLDFDILSFLDQMKAEGKIRHLGFSFHDEYPVFEQILLYRKWDFCQIQLNYMDTNIQAGLKGYALAEQQGVPIIVMEPIKGGRLTTLPKDLTAALHEQNASYSLAAWALRYVASLPNVAVVLSGMSSMAQVQDNLHTFTPFVPFSETEFKQIDELAARLRKQVRNGCTGCEYCMPCPFGVDIPKNFKIWNEEAMYHDKQASVLLYRDLGDAQASKCQACGKCETVCPQHIAIRKDLAALAAYFEQVKA